MNSSFFIAQANADLSRPHPLRNHQLFCFHAPHEAAQELVRALRGGRKANLSGAGSAIRAAHKLKVRLHELMTRFDEPIPLVDMGAPTSLELVSALPDLMADASKDARDMAKLVRMGSTGAVTFAANRADASRAVQLLLGKLERIHSINQTRPVVASTMSVEEMIASATAGDMIALIGKANP